MYTPTATQLDTYLDRVIDHIQQVRQLTLSTDAERQHALDEVRDVQGALALYRQLLRRFEAPGTVQPRLAA